MSEYLDRLRQAAQEEFAAAHAATETETPAAPADPQDPPTEPVNEPTEPPAPPADPEPPAEPPTPNRRVVYKKVVDLGDGSGPQVFKASTKDELIDKLFAAQVNASKRIKGLKDENKALKDKVVPDPAQPVKSFESRQLSEEEEQELTNELQTNPTSALSKAIKALFGAEPDEVREALNSVRQMKLKESIKEIGASFLAAHPEYPVTKVNETLMADYVKKNNLAWTLKNLELAFSELTEAGLIHPNLETPSSTPVSPTLEEEEVVEPIAPVAPAPVAPVVPAPSAPTSDEKVRGRRTVVGISSRQSVATAETTTPHEVSVDDLLRMTPTDRRRIVLQQAGRQA